MAEYITSETVHFVGGMGTKAGLIGAGGGCTKAAWDASGNLSDFMNPTNGSYLVLVVSPNVTLTSIIGGTTAALYAVGAFVGVKIGTIVFANGFTGFTTARYEIIAVTDDQITLDAAYIGADNTDGDCVVGGAFNTLQNAIDSVDNAETVNRYIWTNKDETMGTSIIVNVSGTLAQDCHVFIRGYKTTLGDMDEGGLYYGGAWDAFCIKNNYTSLQINPNAEWVTFDLYNAARNGFVITSAHNNVHFCNFKIDNIATDYYGFFCSSSSYGWSWRNCSLIGYDTHARGIGGNFFRCFVDECYIAPLMTIGVYSQGAMIYVTNSIFETRVGGTGVYVYTYGEGATIDNCLFIGGQKAVQAREDGLYVIKNCTMYNGDSSVNGLVQINDPDATVAVYNNIIIMADTAGLAVKTYTSIGSLMYCDYNCVYSLTGALIHPFWDAGKGIDIPHVGNHNLFVDPLFVDPDNGDFRVKNPKVIFGGKPNVNQETTQMGCSFLNRIFAPTILSNNILPNTRPY